MEVEREGICVAISVIKKRDGRIVPFDVRKISDAIAKSFLADEPERDCRDLCDTLAWEVYSLLDLEGDPAPTVEHVQDIVEQVLMREGYTQTAKSYILYRQARTNIRNREAMGRGAVSLSAPSGPSTFVEQALTVYCAVRDNGGCEKLEGFLEAMIPGVADEYRREYANLLRLALEVTAQVPVSEETLRSIDKSLESQGLSPSLGEREDYLSRQADFLCGVLGCDRETVEQAQKLSAPKAAEILRRRTRRTVSTLLIFLGEAGCPRKCIVPGDGEGPEARLLRDILARG